MEILNERNKQAYYFSFRSPYTSMRPSRSCLSCQFFIRLSDLCVSSERSERVYPVKFFAKDSAADLTGVVKLTTDPPASPERERWRAGNGPLTMDNSVLTLLELFLIACGGIIPFGGSYDKVAQSHYSMP